jgi:hypothetical protein
MTVYDRRDQPAYDSGKMPRNIDPDNPHIMRWWTTAHDAAISNTIEQYQWVWYWHIKDKIVSITPIDVMEAWKNSDPACKRYVWYNALMYFAVGRAEKLGLTRRIRQSTVKLCRLCDRQFREDSLPVPLVDRLGIDKLDFCAPCLSQVLFQDGAPDSSRDEIEAYIRNLTEALSRVPPSDFGRNVGDLHGMTTEERLVVMKVLQSKPSLKRVKLLYGSWLNVLVKSRVLEDDVRRTVRGIQCFANDGHLCLSLGEKTIDDLLYALGISHQKEPSYPEGHYRADFRIGNMFIEYFGLAGDPDYDERTRQKMELCSAHKIKLLAIYPKHLSSVNSLKARILREIDLEK